MSIANDGPGSAGYPACPHDGAKCHHGCKATDDTCYRLLGRMNLTTPWPGYPVAGRTPVLSDGDRERRGAVTEFSHEKEDHVSHAINQITFLATKLADQAKAQQIAEVARIEAAGERIQQAIDAARPALPSLCANGPLQLGSLGPGMHLWCDTSGTMFETLGDDGRESRVSAADVARRLGPKAVDIICAALTRAINLALARSAAITR